MPLWSLIPDYDSEQFFGVPCHGRIHRSLDLEKTRIYLHLYGDRTTTSISSLVMFIEEIPDVF